MAQQVQDLIDKIKHEGIEVAENTAKEIEGNAQQKADDIVQSAEQKAQQIIDEATEEARKMKESAAMALQQSSRNMLLSLRKDIENMLNQIVANDVGDALKGDKLGPIIEGSIKEFLKGNKVEETTKITLSEKDAEAMKSSFVSKLQKQLKAGVEFQPSEDISQGFVISFDNGKSSFDFTDESLAEFICAYLNEEVAGILKKAV